MTVEWKATQKLRYGGCFKTLNKFSETGYKEVYLAIWLVSLLWVVQSQGCARKQKSPLLSTTHMYAMLT